MTAHNAPGKFYRKGISLPELFRMFPDDATAERWFEEQRWGQAGKPSSCPMCGCADNLSKVPSGKPLPYWCGDCRRNFSVRTESIMHRSHIGLQKWVIGIFLWSTSLKGVSSMKLHRDLNITQKSAYFMAQRLREAWSQKGGLMRGPLEVDETYMGGLEKNKHAKKKLKVGGGPSGKIPVVGAKDKAENKIQAKVIEAADKETLHAFVGSVAKPGATVHTDEAKTYKGIPNVSHYTVNHSVGEYVNGQVHTNGIESFWAGLKRAHKGTFHKISHKHLQRYVDEFASRHNLRERDTIVMMQATVAMMDGKRLTYDQLIEDNGLPSGARAA